MSYSYVFIKYLIRQAVHYSNVIEIYLSFNGLYTKMHLFDSIFSSKSSISIIITFTVEQRLI